MRTAIFFLLGIACQLPGAARAVGYPFHSREPARSEFAWRARAGANSSGEPAPALRRLPNACSTTAAPRHHGPKRASDQWTHDSLRGMLMRIVTTGYFAHDSAIIDPGAVIGEGTKVWHFVHVMSGARVGRNCTIGQGCYIGNVTIGDGVKIQNHVSVFDGVTLEDDVFAGPSCVFTNVNNPRSEIDRRGEFLATRVCRGASIGANATIVCGVTIGRYAFIGAGAVVTRDVPDHALVVGVPARQVGWMCRCGARLSAAPDQAPCPACATRAPPSRDE